MKVKIIASLAVVASLLMSGCSHRVPVNPKPAPAPVAPRITGVEVCKFAIYAGKDFYKGKDVTLITYNTGDQWVKFNNGTNKLVIDSPYVKGTTNKMYIIKDYTTDGKLIIGSAYECK